MKGTHLGEAERLMLLAVWRLGKNAHGTTIRQEILERTGRRLSVSAIYVTLVRLEKKGYVSSFLADPTPVRGGKAKRYFTVKKKGITELEESRRRMERMWEGFGAASETEVAS
jgi:DNA-binding PadR family transcriptional regulator